MTSAGLLPQYSSDPASASSPVDSPIFVKHIPAMPSDEVTHAVSGESSKTLVQLVVNTGKSIWTGANEWHKADHACSLYLKKYLGRHGQIRILGMSEPLPLEDVYTEVQCLSTDHLRRWASPEAMQQSFVDSRVRAVSNLDQSLRRYDGVKLANETRYLNVLGAPGSGKSTFLRYLGLRCLEGFRRSLVGQMLRPDSRLMYSHNLLPVLIELRRLRHEAVDLTKLIETELAACGFPSGFTQEALENGSLLILLDGLDEVPFEKLDKTINHISDFVSRYDSCRYVTSCRTAFYKTWFTRFKDIVLADFSDEQIKAFVSNWFHRPHDVGAETAKSLLSQLSIESHAATHELARTPLLAAFLCLVFEQTGHLPDNRAELYGDALRILMERWAAERRVHLEPVFEGLYGKGEILLLEGIAGPAYEKGRFFFSDQELSQSIEAFLQTRLGAPELVDGKKVLKEIETKQGILVERAHGVYSFSHLTLQEYLAACWIYKSGKINLVIEKHFQDTKWREILLLLAGLCEPDADSLLERMSGALFEFLNIQQHKRLREIIQWIESNVSKDGSPEVLLAKRVSSLLIFVIVQISDNDRNISNAIKNISNVLRMLKHEIDFSSFVKMTYMEEVHRGYDPQFLCDFGLILINTFEDHLILKREIVQEAKSTLNDLFLQVGSIGYEHASKREFSKMARNRLLESLGLPPHLREWSNDDAGPTEQYLEQLVRTVECSRAALRVNRSTWERIVGSLLRN